MTFCLPSVVSKEQLPAATAQSLSILSLSTLFGSLLTGMLYTFGRLFPFVIQKHLSFRAAIVSILWVGTALWLLYVCAFNMLVFILITSALYFVIPGYDIIQFSYRSALIPDHLQGRVNSVFRLIAFSGQPLGLALTGLLLQWIGVVADNRPIT